MAKRRRSNNPRRQIFRLAMSQAGIVSLSEVQSGFERRGAPHAHAHYLQALVLLNGSMTVLLAGRRWRLHAGDGVVIQPGEEHRVDEGDASSFADFLDLRLDARRPIPMAAFLKSRRERPVGRGDVEMLKDYCRTIRQVTETPGIHTLDIQPTVLSALWGVLAMFQHPSSRPETRPAVSDPRLANVETLMWESLSKELSVEDMASAARVSRAQLTRLFLDHYGEAPARRFRRLRLERACELLRFSTFDIAQIANACGFVNPNHFSRLFHEQIGMPPTDYRRQHER